MRKDRYSVVDDEEMNQRIETAAETQSDSHNKTIQ